MQYLAFTFTSFDLDDNFIKMYNRLKPVSDFIVVGYEKCPATNRPHYQGYVFLKSPLSLYKFIYTYFQNVHVEPASKPPLANFRYCIKSGLYSVYDATKDCVLTNFHDLTLKFEDHNLDMQIMNQIYEESENCIKKLDKVEF